MAEATQINIDIPAFQKMLLVWYDANKRDLPWRHTSDAYAIWLSEVMLQQTQVKTVIPYYKRWLELFPDINTLAAADQDRVLKAWEGLGYYSRARQFHKAANIVSYDLAGKIPDSYAEFLALPGVGEYTAAAVQSIAFGGAYAVVDGNVKRVLARLFEIDKPVNDASSKKDFQLWADRLLYAERSGDYNQAVMELGATVCKPRNPDCSNCPVKSCCAANKNKSSDLFPRRKAKKAVPHYKMSAGVIKRDNRFLIVRRPENGLLGGLWEFPSGKTEGDVITELDCVESVRNTVGLEVSVNRKIATVKHAYSHFKVEMDVFACSYQDGTVQLKEASDYRWVTREELADYAFPGVNNKFLPLILDSSQVYEEPE
ncbi:MAG: A/G-specific adenine glycosylase [Calditrichota bacterium]